MRNDNQNKCANLISQRKTQNATSSQKICNTSNDSRSKQRSSSTTRGMLAEPAYQTADNLWKGLKQNDLAAQLVLTFAQRLRFNKRTRHNLPAAKRQEDKRLVRILRQEVWNLYLLMRQRAVPNTKKTGEQNRVSNANRKTNKSTTWASRRCCRYSGRTGSSST